MESFLFAIDEFNPEHWSYAVREGVWDTKTTLRKDPIRPGDLLYFWQSGAGNRPGHVAGVAVAQSEMYLRGDAPMPWNLTDDKLSDYKWRIDLTPLRTGSVTHLTWSDIASNTGTPVLQAPRHVPANQEWLAERVLGHSAAERVLRSLLNETVEDAAGKGGGDLPGSTLPIEPVGTEDTRVTTMRAIRLRQGQPKFRSALLENYEGLCAITGCQTVALLDAAHITPYRGEHANRESNGILLRTDIHTLFDRHLLTIVYTDDAYTVRVDPDVDPYYQRFDGSPLNVPSAGEKAPSPIELGVHNDACEFLSVEEARR